MIRTYLCFLGRIRFQRCLSLLIAAQLMASSASLAHANQHLESTSSGQARGTPALLSNDIAALSTNSDSDTDTDSTHSQPIPDASQAMGQFFDEPVTIPVTGIHTEVDPAAIPEDLQDVVPQRVDTFMFTTKSKKELEYVIRWLRSTLKKSKEKGEVPQVGVIFNGANGQAEPVKMMASELDLGDSSIERWGLDEKDSGEFLEWLAKQMETDHPRLTTKLENAVSQSKFHNLLSRFAKNENSFNWTFSIARWVFVGGAVYLGLDAIATKFQLNHPEFSLNWLILAGGGALMGSISALIQRFSKAYLRWFDHVGLHEKALRAFLGSPLVTGLLASLSQITGHKGNFAFLQEYWARWAAESPTLHWAQSQVKYLDTEVFVIAALAIYMNWVVGLPFIEFKESVIFFEAMLAYASRIGFASLVAWATQGLWDTATSAREARQRQEILQKVRDRYVRDNDIERSALYYAEENRALMFRSATMILSVAFISNGLTVLVLPDNETLKQIGLTASGIMAGAGFMYDRFAKSPKDLSEIVKSYVRDVGQKTRALGEKLVRPFKACARLLSGS